MKKLHLEKGLSENNIDLFLTKVRKVGVLRMLSCCGDGKYYAYYYSKHRVNMPKGD